MLRSKVPGLDLLLLIKIPDQVRYDHVVFCHPELVSGSFFIV